MLIVRLAFFYIATGRDTLQLNAVACAPETRLVDTTARVSSNRAPSACILTDGPRLQCEAVCAVGSLAPLRCLLHGRLGVALPSNPGQGASLDGNDDGASRPSTHHLQCSRQPLPLATRRVESGRPRASEIGCNFREKRSFVQPWRENGRTASSLPWRTLQWFPPVSLVSRGVSRSSATSVPIQMHGRPLFDG